MANRMRYGPRFKPTITSAKYEYDEGVDRAGREMAMMFVGLAQQPLHKRELRQYKAGVAAKKRHVKTSPGPEREQSEQRMAEAVRKCVEILEFHMEDLVQHRKVTGRPHYCAQMSIHNVIHELRRKCGVQFDEANPHYEQRLCEDQRRRDQREQNEDNLVEREQQRLSRLRNMREVAERFTRMHNEKAK